MSRLQWLKKKPDVTFQRYRTRMTTSSTRGSEAWFVGWLASGLVTCRQLQTRDGDKSKLRDNGILKDVLNIIDVIAHKLLGVDLWEQAEIDRTMVETPDGSKNDLFWSGANSSADATLAIPRTVCRVGAAKREVSLYTTSRNLQAKPQTSS